LTSLRNVHTGSLDDAFLFMIGLSNFIFSLLQVLLGGKMAFIVFTPFLFAGLLYPFYVGCLRGAVETNSILERVRGWVYFAIGMTAYVSMTTVVYLRDFQPELSGLSLPMYVFFAFVGGYIALRLIRWVIKVTDSNPSESDLLTIGATVGAACLLTFSAFLIEEFMRLWMFKPRYLFEVWAIIFLVVLFALLERVSRFVLSMPGTKLERKLKTSKGALSWVFDGSELFLWIGISSDKVAKRSTIVSIVLSLLSSLLPEHGLLSGAKLAAILFALMLLVFALKRYLKVPIKIPCN